MKKAIFGIIGAGGIAQSQHLPNLTRIPCIDLKTVCDVRKDVLGAMQLKYRVPQAETDYKKVLSDPDIQAVVVATKEDMQAALTVEALKAGKHVYVEKPLANSVEECNNVVKKQKETGKFVAVGFNRRFAPAYVKAKEIVEKHGGPTNIHYRISARYWIWGPPGEHVIKEACHIFDIIRWFTNSEIQSVYCITSRPDDEIFTMKMKSGCVVSVMSSNYVSFDMPKERVEIMTEKGGVVVEDFVELRTYGYQDEEHVFTYPGHTHPDREFTHKYLFQKLGAQALYGVRRSIWELQERVDNLEKDGEYPEKAEIKKYWEETRPSGYLVDKGWIPAMRHFAECVLSGKEPQNAGAADGLAASVAGHKAVESREKGEVVKIN